MIISFGEIPRWGTTESKGMNIFKVLWTFCQIASLGVVGLGSTWWKMSLIAEDRQGWAREKEHSKHSSRKRHSRVTKATALVMCCPDREAVRVSLPFLESRLWILPYKGCSARGTLAYFLPFLEHTNLTLTPGPLHLLSSSTGIVLSFRTCLLIILYLKILLMNWF